MNANWASLDIKCNFFYRMGVFKNSFRKVYRCIEIARIICKEISSCQFNANSSPFSAHFQESEDFRPQELKSRDFQGHLTAEQYLYLEKVSQNTFTMELLKVIVK